MDDSGTLLTLSGFGFLLKLLAGGAAAGFGILGIGTKTRDKHGRLTRHGRIALVGIAVSGALAIGTAIYDFMATQRRERAAFVRSEHLMRSVQRGVYPLRDIKANVTIRLAGDYSDLGAFKRRLLDEIHKDPNCSRSDGSVWCVGSGLYEVGRASTLFPGVSSPLREILDGLQLHVALYRQLTPQETPASKSHASVKYLGRFFIEWKAGVPEHTSLRYDVDSKEISLVVEGQPVSNEVVAEADVYSLVDFFPGFLRATPNFFNDTTCVRLGLDERACGTTLIGPLYAGMTLEELVLTFPYPKALRVFASDKTRCRAQPGNGSAMGLVLQLPDDLEAVDSLGNVWSEGMKPPAVSACDAVNHASDMRQ